MASGVIISFALLGRAAFYSCDLSPHTCTLELINTVSLLFLSCGRLILWFADESWAWSLKWFSLRFPQKDHTQSFYAPLPPPSSCCGDKFWTSALQASLAVSRTLEVSIARFNYCSFAVEMNARAFFPYPFCFNEAVWDHKFRTGAKDWLG